MGRPLNKRFFSGGSGTTVGCNYHNGSSVLESAIISQISNTKYRVAGGGGTPVTGTTLVFANANPDTIADSGASWADFTVTFSAGDSVRVASSENSGENDGVYEIATVTADLITLTDNGALTANAADTTATLALVAPNGVVAKLVQGTPTALGEMQVTVLPELLATADEMEIDFGTSNLSLLEPAQDETDYTGGAPNGAFVGGSGYLGGILTNPTSYDFAQAPVNTITVNTGGNDFATDGVVVGQKLVVASATVGANDGTYTVTNVATTVVTVAEDIDTTDATDAAAVITVFDILTMQDGTVITVDVAGTAGTPAAITEFTVTPGATPLASGTARTVTSETAGGGDFTLTPDILPTSNNEIPRGVVTSVAIVEAGSGFFSGGTFNITIATDLEFVAGTEAVIAYTVNASQEVASVAIQTAGVGYASYAATENIAAADLPDAESSGTLESARIINARTVKTFEGNIYMWPALGATGSLKTRGEADLQTSDL